MLHPLPFVIPTWLLFGLKNDHKSHNKSIKIGVDFFIEFSLDLLSVSTPCVDHVGRSWGDLCFQKRARDPSRCPFRCDFGPFSTPRCPSHRWLVDLDKCWGTVCLIVDCFLYPTKPSTSKPINKPTFQPTKTSTSNLRWPQRDARSVNSYMKWCLVETAGVGAGGRVHALRCDDVWSHVATCFVFVWCQTKVSSFTKQA